MAHRMLPSRARGLALGRIEGAIVGGTEAVDLAVRVALPGIEPIHARISPLAQDFLQALR